MIPHVVLGGLEVGSDNKINTTKLELGGVKNLHIPTNGGADRPVLMTGQLINFGLYLSENPSF